MGERRRMEDIGPYERLKADAASQRNELMRRIEQLEAALREIRDHAENERLIGRSVSPSWVESIARAALAREDDEDAVAEAINEGFGEWRKGEEARAQEAEAKARRYELDHRDLRAAEIRAERAEARIKQLEAENSDLEDKLNASIGDVVHYRRRIEKLEANRCDDCCGWCRGHSQSPCTCAAPPREDEGDG